MSGRRSWWEMPVEENQATLLSHTRGWSQHHSLFPTPQHGQLSSRGWPIIKRLMHWTTEQDRTRVLLSVTDVLIYRVRPQPGRPLYVPHVPSNREGPQARESSKCLNRQSYRESLAKGTFWSPGTRGSKKDSDRAITPAAEAVHVPAHLAPPGSPQAKQLCHLHGQLSLGQSCHRQKKVLRLCAQGHFSHFWFFVTL